MAGAGAVVSEFPVRRSSAAAPLPAAQPHHQRARTAMVVVEAGEKSGALITAARGARTRPEVMVVPGASIGGRNRGGHQLIRDGARLVESADDILE